MALDIGSLVPDRISLARRPAAMKPGSHFVQLYDDDPSLLNSVRSFFGNGLRMGDAAICLASREHLAGIEDALVEEGVDLEPAKRSDAYIPVDAAEALAHIAPDGGMPDQTLFSTYVGDLIVRAANSGRHVRIFGEIVALMWASGNAPAAMHLEELWNDLAEVYPFQLFCAYPVHAFGPDEGSLVTGMCAQHTHVLPPA